MEILWLIAVNYCAVVTHYVIKPILLLPAKTPTTRYNIQAENASTRWPREMKQYFQKKNVNFKHIKWVMSRKKMRRIHRWPLDSPHRNDLQVFMSWRLHEQPHGCLALISGGRVSTNVQGRRNWIVWSCFTVDNIMSLMVNWRWLTNSRLPFRFNVKRLHDITIVNPLWDSSKSTWFRNCLNGLTRWTMG